MKIEELISVFERLLPIYKEAYENNYGYVKMSEKHLWYGLCLASKQSLDVDITNVMYGYYKNLLSWGCYLFKPPSTGKNVKPRIDFMESEIKSLKRLLKKGYTHV